MRRRLMLAGALLFASLAITGLVLDAAPEHQAGPAPAILQSADVGAPNLRAAFSVDGSKIELTLAGDAPLPAHRLRKVAAADPKGLGVELLIVDAGRIREYVYTLTISLLSGPPKPTPDPIPAPPVPAAWTWPILIEESADRTPELTRLLTSKAVRTACGGSGRYPLQRVEQDQAGPFQSFVDYAKGKKVTLPYLILADEAGKLVWEGQLPATEEALLAILKGGK